MKIVYVAKHDSGGADDEGAVAHALEELGHEVSRLRESNGRMAHRLWRRGADLLLFHKWFDPDAVAAAAGACPRAFWYFDLVDWPGDPSLETRSRARRAWMAAVTPHVEFGFCTDGDWVARDTTGKLRWLPQGADGRVAGRAEGRAAGPSRVLFAGTAKGGGRGREAFVAECRERLGDRFLHVPSGVYRERLRDLIRDTGGVVVCPDSPVTDRYWSNRVWNATGFGAVVFHPRSAGLEAMYDDGSEVVMYDGREALFRLLGSLPRVADKHPDQVERMRDAALARTLKEHLYRHRVEELLRVVTRGG